MSLMSNGINDEGCGLASPERELLKSDDDKLCIRQAPGLLPSPASGVSVNGALSLLFTRECVLEMRFPRVDFRRIFQVERKQK